MTSTTAANMTHELTTAVWRKSSRTGSGSGGGGDCVEVAMTTKLVGIRDSKNPSKANLVFSFDQWHNFIRRVKNEELDL